MIAGRFYFFTGVFCSTRRGLKMKAAVTLIYFVSKHQNHDTSHDEYKMPIPGKEERLYPQGDGKNGKVLYQTTVILQCACSLDDTDQQLQWNGTRNCAAQ